MADDILIIFDDTNAKSEIIKDVIGERGFAGVVVKKRKLEDYFFESVSKIFPNARYKVFCSLYELGDFSNILENTANENTRVLHCFSNFIISDKEKVNLSFEKLKYIDADYRVMASKKISAIMFASLKSYQRFLKQASHSHGTMEVAWTVEQCFEIEGLVDIGVVGNFIQCITGNFDSRYFNSLSGNEYIIVKSSTNKTKIESEYKYYHLLPDDMKIWYVMPFDYREDESTASYTMERLHMTDVAIKWVHGSIDVIEFEQLMDKYFYFFKCRHEKEISYEEYQQTSQKLYVKKVESRINQLKTMLEYTHIAYLIEAGCKYKSIDKIVDKYFSLKERIESKNTYLHKSVIGHGDPCFANALYNRSTQILKFIDPKGALNEEDLWTNPYYDIAKLSHSVCGRYDFFNNALFEIRINEELEYELNIDFDNGKYIEVFKKKLEENGYDYITVRLYEASLFLSMLPLHMDYPQKVLGFILNVVNILEEIDKYA